MVVYSGASAGPSHLFHRFMRRRGTYCDPQEHQLSIFVQVVTVPRSQAHTHILTQAQGWRPKCVLIKVNK